jgi:ATP-binding cassette subfamily B protein
MVLEDLNFTIPNNKVTAIVGTSGSGKTTLLSLLLKSYKVTKGKIRFGSADINNISYKLWRRKFACVMQQSFIFSDSIAGNIAVGEEIIDKKKIKEATKAANIREFIEELPVEYNTRIGTNGIGLSQGQKQRILLARAIYKNAEILLLDEATNSLDANNERIIINNLKDHFQDKTVVVVAHRLSTVKDADQIVVLENGRIVEVGNHQSLIESKGSYFNLVKNQLELGD